MAHRGGGNLSLVFTLAEVFQRRSRKIAFTLAEVLITLAVIGIVAALTLPSMIANYKERQIVTRVKANYSKLNQAHRMMTVQNGPLNEWSDQSYETFEKELLKQFKVIKSCSAGHLCGAHYMNQPAHVLSDGTIIQVGGRRDCSETYSTANDALSDKNFDFYSCGSVDIYLGSVQNIHTKNDKNKIFTFVFYPDGVLPQGHKGSGNNGNFRWCGPKRTDSRNCTAWVVYNENIDYTYCKDKLSWDGVRILVKKLQNNS